jgi:hypothetical protein
LKKPLNAKIYVAIIIPYITAVAPTVIKHR